MKLSVTTVIFADKISGPSEIEFSLLIPWKHRASAQILNFKSVSTTVLYI